MFQRQLLRSAWVACGLLARPVVAPAQQPEPPLPISRQFARYSQRTLPEKLFGHLDQPVHAAGELLWLKLYAVDGTYHKPLAMSKVAYVEVLDQARQPVAQATISLRQATGQGAIELPADLPTGRYLVRAYTSWMKNAGPDFYFHTPLTVLNTAGTAGAGRPAAPTYELQFFPEGGSLVQGLPSKVGFRLVDQHGHGLAASGTVRTAGGASVAAFQTLKYGLGSFAFTPLASGAVYTATVRLPGGVSITQPLPAALPQGYVLSLHEASPTQLRLQVQTNLPAEASQAFFLLGHSGQRVAVARTAQAHGGEVSFLVDKSDLLDGISHFTVFNSQRRPVGERLYFRRPSHPLALAATVPRASYSLRARVPLRLAAAAVPASLSVAVYRLDSLSETAFTPDISSYLHLTADLKGTVENPAYYCQDTSQVARLAADNLMLTHGWSRFRWIEVLAGTTQAAEYLPETNGQLVRGRVVQRATGARAPGVTAYLSIPGRAFRFYNAVSQSSGLVQFELRDLYGPQQVIAQTNTLRDSLYQVQLASPFSTQSGIAAWPPLVLPERLAPELAVRHLQAQVQQAYASNHPRPEQLPRPDSTVFYGVPSEQYLLDDFTRFKVLEEVMREYVPGVRVRQRHDGPHFIVADKPRQGLFEHDPLLLLDGVPVFSTRQMLAFDPLKIRRLDVVTSQYLLGAQRYEGVVSYTTYKGDLGGFPLSPQALLTNYQGLQGQREFFAPRYETIAQHASRLPDLRNLLYWNPEIRLLPGQDQELAFYTADQPGRYVVIVQGLGADGQAGSTRTIFEVKPTL